MKRDEIIQAMHKVGAVEGSPMPNTYDGVVDMFQRFAFDVAAKELADIANLLEERLETKHGLMVDETYRMAVGHCVKFLRQMADANALTSLPNGLRKRAVPTRLEIKISDNDYKK